MSTVDKTRYKPYDDLRLYPGAHLSEERRRQLDEDALDPDEITTDGSDAGASISSLVVGDVNVIGPHPSDRSLPAGAYTSASQKKLSIKGHMIRNGQTIMVSGTIAGANDKLMIIIHGKKRVGNCS